MKAFGNNNSQRPKTLSGNEGLKLVNVNPTVTPLGGFNNQLVQDVTSGLIYQKNGSGIDTNWTLRQFETGASLTVGGVSNVSDIQVTGATITDNGGGQVTIDIDDNDKMNTDFSNALPSTKTLNLGGNFIADLADPIVAQHAATKNYVDTQISGISGFMQTDFSNAAPAANAIDLNNNFLQNVSNPVNPGDGTPKSYVDSEITSAVNALSFMNTDFSNAVTATQSIDMGGFLVTGLATLPTNPGDAAAKQYVDTEISNAVSSKMDADFSNVQPSVSNIDMGVNKIVNMSAPTNALDAANKSYVDSEVGGLMQTNFSNAVTSTQSIDMGGFLVTNLATLPTNPGDAAAKQYVDTEISNAVSSKMDTDFSNAVAAANNIDLGLNKIVQVTNPTNPQDAATKDYVDTEISNIDLSTKLNTDLSNLSATNAANRDINMAGFRIVNVANPINPSGVATKDYVDTEISGISGFMATDFSNAQPAANNIDLGNNDLVNINALGSLANTVDIAWINVILSDQGYVVRNNTNTLNAGVLANSVQTLLGTIGFGLINNTPNGESLTNKSLGLATSTRNAVGEVSGDVIITTGSSVEANTGKISLRTGTPATSGTRGDISLEGKNIEIDGLTFTKGMAPSYRGSNSSPLNVEIDDEYIRMQAGAGQVVNLPDLSGIFTDEPRRYIIKNGDPANSLDIVDNVNNNGFDDGGSTLTLAVGESVELVALTSANIWVVFNKG